jgi:hypothetical protein
LASHRVEALFRGDCRVDSVGPGSRAAGRALGRRASTAPSPLRSTNRSKPGRIQPPSNCRLCPPRLAALIFPLVVGALAAAGGAEASICVCVGGQAPALRVNAQGVAEVSWTAEGIRHRRLVTAKGRIVRGRLTGRDVSFTTTAVRIPLKRVLRRTPSGAFWALQSWAAPGHPLNLRFSRWRGKPTRLSASTVCCRAGSETLRGRATFHGTPIYGWVYVDCYQCSLNPQGWARATRKATNRFGFYSVWIRSAWKGTRYRVTITGPRAGWMRAPDARAFARSRL